MRLNNKYQRTHHERSHKNSRKKNLVAVDLTAATDSTRDG